MELSFPCFYLFFRQCFVYFSDSALRRFIVQIMGECSGELGVVYSKAEIIRRLMRISYSNDSLTRAFNLRLLATLSAVISENKRVGLSDIILLVIFCISM